jgi:hypothetical protein
MGRERRLRQLAELQDWFCPLCAGSLRVGVLSVDHVWPRRGKGRPGRGLQQNHLATHERCNHRKGDRQPTGCELVWLTAVNARLGEYQSGPRYVPRRARPKPLPLPTLGEVWKQPPGRPWGSVAPNPEEAPT